MISWRSRRNFLTLLVSVIFCAWQLGNMVSSHDFHFQQSVIESNFIKRGAILNITHDDMQPWQKLLCDWRQVPIHLGDKDHQHFIPPIIHRDITPNLTSDNVFLVESSCNPRPNFREICSVESWANRNPQSPVWYVVTSPFIEDTTGLVKRLLQHYPNLNIVGYNITETIRITPLWSLFTSDRWVKNTPWPPNNLSNMMRAFLVWMWGGFYSDTDGICIKNTKDVINVAALQSDTLINGAILHGSPRHAIYWNLMEYLEDNFLGNAWGHNGPGAITAAVKEICNIHSAKEFRNLVYRDMNCNFTILPESSFYPIPYLSYGRYFEDGKGTQIDKLFKDSYVLHIWNKFSKDKSIRVNSTSIVEEASRRFCPVTYETATKHSDFF